MLLRTLTGLTIAGCGVSLESPRHPGKPDGATHVAGDSGDAAVTDGPGDAEDAGDDGGLSDTAASSDSGDDADTGPAVATDYRLAGPYTVSTSEVSHTVDGGSVMTATVYEPEGGPTAPRVILAHGFARSPTQMVGWARHIASWGLPTVTPALLHASAWDADHAANGRDLSALNAAMGGGAVLYAGHSAGGLAAVLAGAEDDDAVAVVGLDLTDSDDLGVGAAASLDLPIYGIVGEPSDCNASGNGIDLYRAAPLGLALQVTEADHCDFEDETDWICTSFCAGENVRFSAASIQGTIAGLATAAVLDAAGLTDGLSPWWREGGVFYDALMSEDALSPL